LFHEEKEAKLYINDKYKDFEILVGDTVFEMSYNDLTSDSESELSVAPGRGSINQ
jgi:hypothetical protein